MREDKSKTNKVCFYYLKLLPFFDGISKINIYFWISEMKLAWSKKMVRKWFNIKSKTEEFQADDPTSAGNLSLSLSLLTNFVYLFLFFS